VQTAKDIDENFFLAQAASPSAVIQWQPRQRRLKHWSGKNYDFLVKSPVFSNGIRYKPMIAKER